MIVDGFTESERPTRPTQPPTNTDLMHALAETNELLISVRDEFRASISRFVSALDDLRADVETRLDNLERQAAE